MYKNKSLLGSYWKIKEYDDRLALFSSQKNNISPILSKLLSIRNISENLVDNFLNPDLKIDLPNPFLLKDMEKAVQRTIKSIKENEKIGIIADYDVDGSTSASILFKFLINFNDNIIIKTPNRLSEGYGPNIRIMDEMLNLNVKIIFTLDCGTSSFKILDNSKYSDIDIIVIDHHLSETILPNVFSIINPNRIDESNNFTEMAAVGVTFLFLMALRKKLREENYFNKNFNEPNLINYLDLVALGTVCDVVNLTSYNRTFVKLGLELINKRKNKGITKIIDNSNLKISPTSTDLGYIIGPQLNAASRLDDSSLPSKLLISDDLNIIENISRKLFLLNEKRKLIEKNVFDEAIIQADKQISKNFILVYGKNWHRGILGIVASKLTNKYNKPSFVISFHGSEGVGSARSVSSINLVNIILNAKNDHIIISGGGHKMAAGLKINFNLLDKFLIFLENKFKDFPIEYFQKIEYYDSLLSLNEINLTLLEIIEQMEPYGSGNPEPKFIIEKIDIKQIKVIKEKHILIFLNNDLNSTIKGICFNCINTALGDYLLNYKKYKLNIGCSIKKDNFSNSIIPQIIIKDAMIAN